MWSLALLAFLAYTCVDLAVAFNQWGYGGGFPAYDPYMPFMGGLGGPDFLDDRSGSEPELLNCFASFLTPDGRNIASELAVNIEPHHDADDGFGDVGFGMGMGMGYGMGGVYGGDIHSQKRPGLTARIELINNIGGGKGYIVFTKTARSEDGCFKESFGDVLLPSDVDDDKFNQQHHAMAGYGLGGYGMMGYGMDLGMMGYGMGFGMGHHGNGRMFEDREGEGVIAEMNITPGALASAVIEDVGFTDLKQLAGRGVLICSSVSYDWDWKPTCDEPFYSCCSLKYDNKGVTLAPN